jgi:DNA repair exonuclease SbcCD ATPase subunit
MITHIFHISDIHIFDKNYKNIINSWKQLVKIICEWPSYKTNVLLVITGDIFEYKTHLNSDDIRLFYDLMNQLESMYIRTIIIPGNHDYNINSKCAQDNISILLRQEWTKSWKYVQCYPKTGAYIIDNICFYVYSPIDKLTPLVQDNGKKKIALLHEPIISAKYDNNESIFNGRFKQNDLQQYDIVMLGDIHKPQFLAPNMAYAGSFVQKNKGEGINHGYILWDVDKCIGKHHWIPLAEIALKIVAIDNKFAAPLPNINADITYIGLIYRNCSADWLKEASNIIRDKYKMPISQIIRNESTQKLKLDIPNTLQMESSSFSHANLIIEKLKKSNTGDDMINRVLDYHNKFMQNRQLAPTIRYYIKYLAWSNVFCYGPDNFINFEELHGLVALVGRNKIGKSSIIDILLRILFNECERGHKDDIINKHAKSAYIKCCFRIINDDYIIEQSWQKYTTATTFHLYKNGEEITKDTLVKTYKYIRDDLGLGNYKDFVNLTTALQNRKFIIDLDKKDIYSLLCKLLDIDAMRDIEEHVKKERDFLRRDKKIRLKELDALGPELNREDAWEKEKMRIQIQRDNEIATRDTNLIKLNTIVQQICDLHRKIQIVDLDPNWKPQEVQSIKMPYNDDKYSEYTINLNNLKIELEVYRDRLSQFDRTKIKQINSQNFDKLIEYIGVECHNLPDDIIELSKSRLWHIDPLKTSYNYDELVKYLKCQDTPDPVTEFTNQKKIINMNPPPEPGIDELKKILQEYSDTTPYLHEYRAQRNAVKDIIKDVKTIYNNIDLSGDEIYKYHENVLTHLNSLYDQYNKAYHTAKKASKIDIDKINSSLDDWKKYETIQKNNDIIRKSMIVQKWNDVQHDFTQHIHMQENDKIRNAENLCKQYNDIIYRNQYAEIKEKITSIKNEIYKLQELIDIYDNAVRQEKEYSEYDANLAKYKQIQINNMLDANIDELKKIQCDIVADIKASDDTISTYDRNIENIKNLSVRYAEIKHKIIEIDDALSLYDVYYECINHKTGIPSNILKRVCNVLSDRCNDILNNITDFNVEFVFDEEIRIYTISKTSGVDVRLSASLGSGFQKFLLDMIMRIVLTKISNISNPNILFVDEGFGCLDKSNFTNVCSCLMKMKSNFDAMIVITHIPELQSYMDQLLEVSNDGLSKLQFGQLTIDDYDLFENINLRIIKQTIDNNRTSNQVAAKDKNPEVIVLADAPNEPSQSTIWDKEASELCAKFNIEPSTLSDEIYKRIIIQNGDTYTCQPCQKSFKKIEQSNAHIYTKTYKTKHYKFLMS